MFRKASLGGASDSCSAEGALDLPETGSFSIAKQATLASTGGVDERTSFWRPQARTTSSRTASCSIWIRANSVASISASSTPGAGTIVTSSRIERPVQRPRAQDGGDAGRCRRDCTQRCQQLRFDAVEQVV